VDGCNFAAACGTAFFGVLASIPGWRWRQRAWLFCIALITLFWSWPMTMELFWGQVNLVVTFAITLAAYLATRARYFAVGVVLGLAAAQSRWTAYLVVWILRRGGRRKGRTTLGVILVGGATVVLSLVFGGLPTLRSMVSGPFQGTDQPDVVAYSAWGLGKALVGGLQWAQPIVDSPSLRGRPLPRCSWS
jgi:alpha-1,2-mannosyltransferase